MVCLTVAIAETKVEAKQLPDATRLQLRALFQGESRGVIGIE
jgi:hypothetical protein